MVVYGKIWNNIMTTIMLFLLESYKQKNETIKNFLKFQMPWLDN